MTAAIMESAFEISIVTPEAQNALVEIYRVLEKVAGKAPSNAVVFAAARGIDVAFKDSEAKSLLSKFRNARPGPAPLPLLVRTSHAPEIEHERTSSAPDAPLARPDGAGATRAGDKVLLVPKPEEVYGDDDQDDAPFTATDRAAKSPGYEFGMWFFGAAFGAGIESAKAIYPGAIGLATEPENLQSAIALTATYPMAECKIRARRMFARKLRTDQHKWHSRVTPATLLKFWDMFDSDDVGRPSASAPAAATTAYGQDYAEKARRRLEAVK